MTLHFIHTYRIGYELRWGERTTFKDIAQQSNLDVGDTQRMLRLAMTEHFFDEPENGVVIHTAASYELARNPLLSAWVGLTTQENWPPMLKLAESLRKHPGSEEPLESASSIVAHYTVVVINLSPGIRDRAQHPRRRFQIVGERPHTHFPVFKCHGISPRWLWLPTIRSAP
jgi:hypothetical protein